jgi:flagellar hook assembly protein FlgD
MGAPAVTRLLGSFPNPFTSSTSVRYELAGSAPVRLRIYDVNGRLVRQLVDGTQGAGANEAAWNGQTDNGSRAASGTYFLRLEALGVVETRRTVLLR